MEEKKEKTYQEFLTEKLAQHITLRHLFNKINQKVIVCTTNGEHIKGILKTIDLSYRILELIDPELNRVFFIKTEYIIYIETPQNLPLNQNMSKKI
jgi:hypothetical protein